MATPQRGEVWLIDFGSARKTLRALVVSVAFGGQERARCEESKGPWGFWPRTALKVAIASGSLTQVEPTYLLTKISSGNHC